MGIKRIIFNQQGNVRTVFKLLAFVLLFQLIGILLLRTTVPLIQNSPFHLSYGVNAISCAAMLLALWVFAKYVDKSSLAKYGLYPGKGTAVQFGIGTIVGLVAIISIIGLQWFNAEVVLDPNSTFKEHDLTWGYMAQLLRYLSGSLFEELLTTSFLFILIFYAIGAKLKLYNHRYLMAIGASAVLFGLVHGFNENATILGVINLLIFGAVTTTNFARTRNLAFAIGFHCFWNFGQNILFGLPNSGKPSEAWIFKTQLHSSDWITGGLFGLEGSLIATFVLGAILIYNLIKLRNSLE
ncbi:CPBP family intramembrane metalloprotease [Muricauda sp. CAU 1633]|uniref:CPBP family intramembrane glutamic endopeptidase n=1 Tax=Allomuricauda sp. CAU 1633 TaxID=2816036 RepID=UPI001A8E4A67|nr:CPBP family intramembrane glutamic endopeptidase [Muricauda sp. CAU 1633]MBO0323199.1 CPBP family intramembrane metalloprotease [Muricauda sp. CAU 1633]